MAINIIYIMLWIIISSLLDLSMKTIEFWLVEAFFTVIYFKYIAPKFNE